jgi:hypothetical protein
LLDVIHRVLLVIRSRADTARSESSVDIQIDLWNRHMTNNNVWVFSHEIKEMICILLFIIIYRVLHVHRVFHASYDCPP